MLGEYIILFFVTFNLHYHFISTLDSCETRNTCQECISDPSVCVWCAKNEFNGTTRCKPQSNDTSWCPEPVQNPINFINATDIKEFGSNSEHVIQIKPQRYKLNLRPGIPERFNFSFQAAKDFPVDLYFLLDASQTMKKIRDTTAAQSENIYSAIKNMTNNVYLGLGTFIDKRLLPFTKTFDSQKTYSFRHRLKLIDNFKQFKNTLSLTPSGENYDIQEGGLDALAQVLVCKDIIGWRNESRKIVIFITDGPYHAAGDGKSAGLFQPYDGECYTKNNSYTKELQMDYPSAAMINKLAAERDIIIIFLVDNVFHYVYHDLSGVVGGSKLISYTRNKLQKSDAMVTILKDIYEKISKKIKLKVNVKSGPKKNYKISFTPDCTSDDSGSACDVEVGKEQKLAGTVKLLEYDGSDNAVVDIIVEGIGEKLTLDIDVIKSCECENHAEENSKYCYGEKRLCGICNCSDERYGDRCACVKSTNNTSNDNSASTCIAEGSKDICSGRGSCICGTCQCREGYEGKFCDCNDASCPLDATGSLCGGHGKCECGTCKCGPSWSGEACDCFTAVTDCLENDGSICNNRGECVCGSCVCKPIAEWDARNYQDSTCKVYDCPECHELQCRKLEDCAKCQRNEEEDCSSCDERIRIQVVQALTKEYTNNSEWKECKNLKVEVGCYTSFVYQYNSTDYILQLVVQKEKDCAESYYWFGGIFLLTLLLVGAGTLIAWKLLTEARDRHEYLRFMKQNQQDSSGPSSNPLYESPTTTFNNPAFRKKSVH